ncbi:MAG TPA: hypothetical protein VER04_30225, partial [Polyangiaceae bacterium]|nr:hypothetical protein [Polyangiaceae bacterium]
MTKVLLTRLLGPLALAGVLASACGSSDDDRPTNTGQACQVPGDCYPGIDPTTLQGEPVCLT